MSDPAREPAATEPVGSGLLSTLSDLGRSALAGAVSSMGSPPRPEPGPPPANQQYGEQYAAQQAQAGVHAIQQPQGELSQQEGVPGEGARSAEAACSTSPTTSQPLPEGQGLGAPGQGPQFQQWPPQLRHDAAEGATAQERLPSAILGQSQLPMATPLSPAYRSYEG